MVSDLKYIGSCILIATLLISNSLIAQDEPPKEPKVIVIVPKEEYQYVPAERPEDIKVMRVIVNEEYDEVEDLYLPFMQTVRKILNAYDIEVVGGYAENYDATLNIIASGAATSKSWNTIVGRLSRYSGAELQGEVSLQFLDETIFIRQFKTKEEFGFLDGVPLDSYKKPNEAPFYEAFWKLNSFPITLVEMACEFWDMQKLTPFIQDENASLRRIVAVTLEKKDWQPLDKQQRTDFLISKHDWAEVSKIKGLAAQSIIDLLKDEDADVREGAAQVLGDLNNKLAIDTLIAVLGKDESSEVKAQAAKSLGKLGAKAAIAPLVAALGDHILRDNASVALKQIKDPRSTELLINFLNSILENSDTPTSYIKIAAETLSEVGGRKAKKELNNLLSKEDLRPEYRVVIQETLDQLEKE